MNRRVIMRIELEPESKDRLDDFCRRTGMTKVAASSRIINWFSRQPDTVQAMIQGLFPSSIEPDVARIILKQLAVRPGPMPSIAPHDVSLQGKAMV